jgi:hypothetical protein
MGTKLVQGECRTKQKPWFLFFMPSRSLTWAKPKCARRVEYKANRKAFAFIPEPQPNLRKAKVYKASAGQNKNQGFCFSCRGAAPRSGEGYERFFSHCFCSSCLCSYPSALKGTSPASGEELPPVDPNVERLSAILRTPCRIFYKHCRNF